MATESVIPHRSLTLDEVDRAHELIHQATAIVDLVSCANKEDVIDIAIPGGCWAIRNMLGELKTIVSGKDA